MNAKKGRGFGFKWKTLIGCTERWKSKQQTRFRNLGFSYRRNAGFNANLVQIRVSREAVYGRFEFVC